MLTIERTKALLMDPTLSDEAAEEIRDQFHWLAEVIFEKWRVDQDQRKRRTNQ